MRLVPWKGSYLLIIQFFILIQVNVYGNELSNNTKDESITQQQTSNSLSSNNNTVQQTTVVVSTGPLIDLLGQKLLSLEMIDETHAQIHSHATAEVLKGNSVVGLYFSADWCGPCRRFTPELVAFFQKINKRRGGSSNTFTVVWISRCKDIQAWGQYFTQMNGFYALPPEEAIGPRGNALFQKYKGTSIPYLVLIEGDTADLITTDARNKISQDKAGIGFPWRSPIVIIYNLICPKSLRYILRDNSIRFWMKIQAIFKGVLGFQPITNK